MTEKLLSLISKRHPLTEIDCGEFAKMKVSGMKFNISAYKAEGLGQVSVMRAVDMLGLMKMDTLIINPTELDLPLYSYDRIFAMGNDTLIVELYDTTLGEYDESRMLEVKAKEKYSALPERDPGEHWYDSIKLKSSISKKGKKNHLSLMQSLTDQHFEAYLKSSHTPVTDAAAKQEKANIYVDGLITKGGPSTDVFKKAIGEEKTRELFENILFGTRK
jgi:hypothetical protein